MNFCFHQDMIKTQKQSTSKVEKILCSVIITRNSKAVLKCLQDNPIRKANTWHFRTCW